LEKNVFAQAESFAAGDASFLVSRLQTGDKQADSVWFQKMHYHSFYEIHYLLDGYMIYDTGQRQITVPPHAVCIVPPSVKHRFIPCSADAKRISFYISFDRVASEPKGIYDKILAALGSDRTRVIRDRQICNTFEQLSRMNIWSGEPIGHLQAQALLQLILLRIASVYAPVGTESNTARSGEMRDMASSLVIEHYIWENYANAVTVGDAAEFCGLSVRGLERVCIRSFGKPFSELLQDYRMDTAKNLISTTELKLSKIAELTGYTSYDGFYKAWTKHFGCSPSKIKKE
jgi:AraC-like DNA-binding protein